MTHDICDKIRERVEEVRGSWNCIPLRERLQKADWRDRAMMDIELMEAAAQTIDSLRVALREAHRTALALSEERVRNSYRIEGRDGL